MSDPFAAFGDDDDDESSSPSDEKGTNTANNKNESTTTKTTATRRTATNGVLTFHTGTEQALLHAVLNENPIPILPSSCSTSVRDNNNRNSSSSSSNRRQGVIVSVDRFCLERHWMMHVGPQKGLILEAFLLDHARPGMQLVELGTYCGYSLIRMADALLRNDAMDDDNFCIFTVDVNPSTQAVAKKLVQAAGLSKYVTFILLEDTDDGSSLLSDRLKLAFNSVGLEQRIDFLFVDHAKELYLSDVQQLEATGLLRAKSAVAADNVVFFKLDAYRQHMARLASEGIVETRLETDNVMLEYVHPDSVKQEVEHAEHCETDLNAEDESVLRDGLELTVYIRDPPS